MGLSRAASSNYYCRCFPMRSYFQRSNLGMTEPAKFWLAACWFIIVPLIWLTLLGNENARQGAISGFAPVPSRRSSKPGVRLFKSGKRDDEVGPDGGELRETEVEDSQALSAAGRQHLGHDNGITPTVSTRQSSRNLISIAIRARRISSGIPDSSNQLLPAITSPRSLRFNFSSVLAVGDLVSLPDTEATVSRGRAPPNNI